MSYTARFHEIRQPARKVGNCPVCHKRVVRQTTFTQTESPFNRNQYGNPKTRAQIVDELILQARHWEPDFTHDGCQ